MTFSSYDTVIEDGSREARGREREALNHGIDLLTRLGGGQLVPPQDAEALLFVRKLWTFFVQDLSSDRNGLPEKLRAELISIGLWVIGEADRVREERSTDVAQLLGINIIIRDALA
ncbi:flagellar biosynthesis regulator FlaF [Bradyrhizobium sp. U87765 SZCCT0131]|uniref:flagellar biosynthesis regulator FlaF n=1 Tax=unclassified Bradyrhizobium TaxID=2631580 RepID=UPI001BADB494|nr:MULTISPECIES: flagellar biosynthesis regulator FlaF [unclassified Bradyrhizobium]MBR1216376.1 flagellar biosynthesis regulator FlaF [Bradyrhizobium sp. U87765 SZCCT0131]MBR1259876.1 flagellar biosynthesis regulator FlaF [Bradyrhizobium sp. U87765 SZCCT0134]MBR1306009.1 flagellar biosynthesis regulator FlaF [Bradyrhizobium sp. U87765 SZCCT0110]MBR1322376.1 flagellar biosynthesis regulator FlaF [Bradyrhizobium sp. U87765 SZCCT0109]MBR1352333.1 flagellar biosynthesis regulator FlaF [Bradyrhizo